MPHTCIEIHCARKNDAHLLDEMDRRLRLDEMGNSERRVRWWFRRARGRGHSGEGMMMITEGLKMLAGQSRGGGNSVCLT